MAAPRAAWRNRGTTYNGKCGGVRQSAQGEIGTYTTLAPRDEPKRWQLGPTILFDRPRPAPSTPPASDFPRGVAQRWRREQSRGASGAAVWRNFSNRGPQAGADGEGSSRRRELRWRPRERRGGIAVQRTTENAAAFGSRRRVGIGTYTTLAPLDEPKRWQLGPTILFDRPRPAPHSPCIRFPPWGRCDAIERKAKRCEC
jgi:hypothetical protein